MVSWCRGRVQMDPKISREASSITMGDVHILYDHLEEETPFAFARFNDGELAGIIKPGTVVARGDQLVDETLQQSLIRSIGYTQPYYYVGIPCPKCFPHFHMVAAGIVHPDSPILPAVALTNMNLGKTQREFTRIMKERRWSWLGGEDQDITKLPWYNISNSRYNVHLEEKYPKQNCWAVAKEIEEKIDLFEEGEVVFLSLGPTSRPLTALFFSKRPDVTFIDIGSTFDNYTRDVWLKCHKFTVPHCHVCNSNVR